MACLIRYMELLGKGDYGKGLLYVALRVPEGYFTANANQARISTFLPCEDASTCMMAPDVTTFAIGRGLWQGSPTDPTFSFSDVYADCRGLARIATECHGLPRIATDCH